MNYTTVELVSKELGGQSISSSTTPSYVDVFGWIQEAMSDIDMRTSKTWSSTAITDELVDYDGSGYVKLPYAPIISISALTYNANSLGNATDYQSLTEGVANDFIFYPKDGQVEFFGNNLPSVGTQRIKWSGVIGYATVPKYIQRLATLMVASRYADTVVNSSISEEGGSVTVGNISITDPSNFSLSATTKRSAEIDNIFKTIPISATHRSRRINSIRMRYR